MLRSILATAALAVAASFCASAQTVTLKATVPFKFQMGKSVMPAGEYTVYQNHHVLRLQSVDGKAALALVQSEQGKRIDRANGLLVFNRYGNDYFLSKIYAPNSTGHAVLPASSAERELLARIRGFDTAAVTASTK